MACSEDCPIHLEQIVYPEEVTADKGPIVWKYSMINTGSQDIKTPLVLVTNMYKERIIADGLRAGETKNYTIQSSWDNGIGIPTYRNVAYIAANEGGSSKIHLGKRLSQVVSTPFRVNIASAHIALTTSIVGPGKDRLPNQTGALNYEGLPGYPNQDPGYGALPNYPNQNPLLNPLPNFQNPLPNLLNKIPGAAAANLGVMQANRNWSDLSKGPTDSSRRTIQLAGLIYNWNTNPITNLSLDVSKIFGQCSLSLPNNGMWVLRDNTILQLAGGKTLQPNSSTQVLVKASNCQNCCGACTQTVCNVPYHGSFQDGRTFSGTASIPRENVATLPN